MSNATQGSLNFYAMADLGTSVNVMPRGMYEYLKLANLRKTSMLVEMADMTKKAPLGVVENILVRIDRFLFPFDFVSIDSTPNETIILDRPFLATFHGEIDVFNKEISLGVDPDKDPKERSFDDYKEVFDLEIDKLANEYELGTGKKGHILEEIWENCKKVHGKDEDWWYVYWLEEDKNQENRDKGYNPPKVHLETFKVTRYSFDNGNNFICVTNESKDTLSLGRESGSQFRKMI
ncbi:putative reverse transcriptase domain-containing protein [Tanacetum coccineum]